MIGLNRAWGDGGSGRWRPSEIRAHRPDWGMPADSLQKQGIDYLNRR
jgi:hypothetical protein